MNEPGRNYNFFVNISDFSIVPSSENVVFNNGAGNQDGEKNSSENPREETDVATNNGK